jgi:hypothetical protein
MFALGEELTMWEAQLVALQGAARLDLLVTLAWHLRQRNPARARNRARSGGIGGGGAGARAQFGHRAPHAGRGRGEMAVRRT